MSAEVLTAIATLAAAVVSVVAVVVAARAASAAEKSADVAVTALHRSAARDLTSTCHEVLAEDLRIHAHAISLRSEATSLGVFSGTSGGSQETNLKGTTDQYIATAAELTSEARTLTEDPGRLLTASDADLDQMAARLDMSRVKLRAIRELLESHVAEARAMNQLYRDKRM
jgi:hypothetical protein